MRFRKKNGQSEGACRCGESDNEGKCEGAKSARSNLKFSLVQPIGRPSLEIKSCSSFSRDFEQLGFDALPFDSDDTLSLKVCA